MINNLKNRMAPRGEQLRHSVVTDEWVDPATGEYVIFGTAEEAPADTLEAVYDIEGHAEKSEGPLRKLTHHVLATGYGEKHPLDDREPVEGLTFSA